MKRLVVVMKEIQKIRLSKTVFNEVLLWVLLFFGLFDTARNYTRLPIQFGYLKDIALYLLFFINIGRIRLQRILGAGFYLWFLVVLLGTPTGFFFSGYNKVSILIACFKYIEFFLLMLIFTNWNQIFGLDMTRFIRRYIYGSLILCFVNVFGYFVDNPIVSRTLANSNMDPGLYVGRITVGQPAVAIFPVILSFIYLMVTSEKKRMDKYLIVIFLVCIILATSNTGILAVILSLAIICVCGFLTTQNEKLKRRLLFFAAIGLICLLFLICSKNQIVIEAMSFYKEKIGKYFTGSTDAMMDLRRYHWKNAIAAMEPVNYIFGVGAYGYIPGNTAFPVENTYRITFLMYGVVGLCSMMAFLVRWFIIMCRLHRQKQYYGIFGICLLVVFTFHMYTLDIYLMYTLYFGVALFYSYIMHETKKQIVVVEEVKTVHIATDSISREVCNV